MNRPPHLEDVLNVLRTHEADLRQQGIAHAAVFGSVARQEATPTSDVDILVDLDPQRIPESVDVRRDSDDVTGLARL